MSPAGAWQAAIDAFAHVRAARPVPCPRRAGWPTRWATWWSSLPQPLIDLQGSKHAAIGEREEGRAFRSAAAAAAVVAKPAAAAPDARGSGSKTRACANSAGLAASAHRLRRVGPPFPAACLPRRSRLCHAPPSSALLILAAPPAGGPRPGRPFLPPSAGCRQAGERQIVTLGAMLVLKQG